MADRLESRRAEGAPAALAVGLKNWSATAEAYARQDEAVCVGYRTARVSRRELRGRLDALKAKARGYGVAELVALASVAQQRRCCWPRSLRICRVLRRRWPGMSRSLRGCTVAWRRTSMSLEACKRPGCNGHIEDGYCDVCGHAAVKGAAAASATAMSSAVTRGSGTVGSGPVTTGTGSSPMSRSVTGSRRSTRGSSRTTRKQLGAGLITLPDLPFDRA